MSLALRFHKPGSSSTGSGKAKRSPLQRSAPRLRTLPLPFLNEPSSPAIAHTTALTALTVITQDACSAEDAATTLLTPLPDQAISRQTSTTSTSTPSSASSAQQALVAQLAREVKHIEVAGRATHADLGRTKAIFSTGCEALDGCLPERGYASGTVVEYLQGHMSSGATTLALVAAREALTKTDRFCVVVDWEQRFYPPAAAALGIDLKRVVIVRPHSLAERLWAIDQALQSPAIAAVVAQVEQMDDRAARRLQLAAERGGSVGLLVRGSASQHHPSWAEVQWMVQPIAERSNHRQLQLDLIRARGASRLSSVRVQLNAANGRLEPAQAATATLARSLARKTSSRPHAAGRAC